MTPHHPAARRLALGLGLLALAAAIWAPRASEPFAGLARGDVTLAVRFALMALASLGLLLAASGLSRRALLLWLAALAPPLLFVKGFPAPLAPLGLVPWYAGVLRARTAREAALVGACAGGTTVLGAAGWIFHYFADPSIPAGIALAIAASLWGSAALATFSLVRRSPLWIPVAAALLPLGEVARCQWLSPPLPGLLVAHANADTALIRLAPWLGEEGIAFVVALIGLTGAALLAARRLPLRAAPRVALLAVAAAAGVAVGPAAEPAPSPSAPTRVCSIQDPLRSGGNEAFDGAGDVAIFALAEHAKELGCALVAFPEYSLRLEPRQVVPADWGLERLGHEMVVIGGASIVEGQGDALRVRNVVCRLHLGPARQINCAGAFDKLVFAPFGEAGLFQDTPLLARAGAWISRRATGSKFSRLTSLQPVGLLPLGRGWRSGVAICWEILVPDIFEQRGVAGRGSVDLLAVPSDLDGFGGSAAAIDQLRRAASLHALALGAPLLFASTHDPFLVTASGRIAQPVGGDRFVTVWEIALPAPAGV